jgi:type II secretory pathway pseudopilin PulG
MVATREDGFTYLMVLFIVAIVGGGLAAAGKMWETAARREKEAELLFVGHQYRRAIERYYLSGPRQYPGALADLLKDPRRPNISRYLRRLYPDPITGKEWALVKAPGGGIMGIHSVSEEKPLKTGGFSLRDAGFEDVKTYAEWTFVYVPLIR